MTNKTFIAIETSANVASVSLYQKGNITSLESEGVNSHSQVVLPMVQHLLKEGDVTLNDCDAIAFGCGPGSFTGVRTACGIAKGFALGTNRPLISIVGLMAMAESVRQKENVQDVLSIIDARMGEVYWAQYRYENLAWKVLIEPCVTLPFSVKPIGRPLACGNGLSAYKEAFASLDVLAKREDIMPHSEAIVSLAPYFYNQGLLIDDALPLYLRNKVAYTTKEREAMKEISC